MRVRRSEYGRTPPRRSPAVAGPSRRTAHLSFRNHSRPPTLCRVSDVTHILERVERGDGKAAAELLPLVYDELRRLAADKMANEAPGHTLQPTALVHEAWLRLVRRRGQHWNSRN